MELLAWIAEMDIYQLNRISDRHKLKFLALSGDQAETAAGLRTVLSFRLVAGMLQFHCRPECSSPVPILLVNIHRSSCLIRSRCSGQAPGDSMKDAEGFQTLRSVGDVLSRLECLAPSRSRN
jgi:hypothetical protein